MFAARFSLVKVALSLFVLLSLSTVTAQGQIVQRQVGGVFIDADGALRNISRDETGLLMSVLNGAATGVPGDMDAETKLRKVSLRKLEAALAVKMQNGAELPDDIKYLAGLTAVHYVFVYPDQQDIVLAGPGEGWKLDGQGVAIGKKSGRPVLLLDDLLIALRSAKAARQVGISCSIDPTKEGRQRLEALVRQLKQMSEGVGEAIEQAMGPQQISVTGIPVDSHFARVIVAADYKMKRIAMNLDPCPVKQIPNYISMIGGSGKGVSNMMPRWWLAMNYESVLMDKAGTAYEFRGAGVKAMSEEDFVDAKGDIVHSGKTGGPTKKWADNMTKHYEELAQKDSIFAQLRNCMDLALVAALIEKQNLTTLAGYQFSTLIDESDFKHAEYPAPKTVATQASIMRKGSNFVITASGGVQIESWQPLEKMAESTALAPIRDDNHAKSDAWWWN